MMGVTIIWGVEVRQDRGAEGDRDCMCRNELCEGGAAGGSDVGGGRIGVRQRVRQGGLPWALTSAACARVMAAAER